MMKFILTPETVESIKNYENEYMTNCAKLIEKYVKQYLCLGYEINYDIFWRKRNSGLTYHIRPCYDDNYECWFGYEVIKNGELVCIDKIEGYTIGESYGFLFIRKKRTALFKKSEMEVTYINDLCDLEMSLDENLRTISNNIGDSKNNTRNNTGDG